jgi:hypothetical protein
MDRESALRTLKGVELEDVIAIHTGKRPAPRGDDSIKRRRRQAIIDAVIALAALDDYYYSALCKMHRIGPYAENQGEAP